MFNYNINDNKQESEQESKSAFREILFDISKNVNEFIIIKMKLFFDNLVPQKYKDNTICRFYLEFNN